MTASACQICGATPAPFGFRLPGLRRDLPERFRDRYLKTCAAAACREAAETRARRAAGLGPIGAPSPAASPRPAATPAPPARNTPPPPPATPDLFGG